MTVKKTLNYIKNYPIIWLGLIYLLFRFPNLTLLPIFNDESIYLDWGWRMTHVKGFLYYSMYDAKQPLIMWLFGISSSIFADPLFAGRFISLLLGLLSTIGIYFVGKDLFDKRTGIIAAFTYIVVPIFVLFDRQALLESAVTTCSVWAFYFVYKSLITKNNVKNEILAGLSIGLGYFSKTTALLFIIPTAIIYIYRFYKSKNSTYIKKLLVVACVFITTIALILINPQFWQTLTSNSRYVYSIPELARFPISRWVINLNATSQISFFFITPFIFLFALFQIIRFVKNKKHSTLLLWIIIPLIVTLLTVKFPSQRYTVSLLPFFTIFYASFFDSFKTKRILYYFSLVISLIIPLAMSTVLVYDPLKYFQLTNRVTSYSEYGTVSGQTSGYGIDEVIEYIKFQNDIKKIVVTYAENTGNPESALSMYMSKKNIMNGYFELRYLNGIPEKTDCIELVSGQDIYFVSRDEQLAGFEKFVDKVKTIKKPVDDDTIGIYKFKKDCKNAIRVNPVFNGL